MPETVIHVEHLSKKYALGINRNGDGLRHVIHGFATAPFRWLRKQPGRAGHPPGRNGAAVKPRESAADFWALRDLSFEVKQGEVMGVIGRNGAGKSTLLKILSRITEQTEGRVEITGRVASLLEVGTGFHPELSGRENVFLNGAILGMGRTEIRRKFDEIVAFAEVEKFLDTPVKRYSSGMYVRLAFAVAAHLEPEILIIDEVLAVGDAEFQKKCLGKMHDVAHSGRTVLFVSHNIGAVMALCDRGLYLKKGQIVKQDLIGKVTHAYLTDGYEQGHAAKFDPEDDSAGDEVARVKEARIISSSGMAAGTILVGQPVDIEITYEILQKEPSPRVNLHLITEEGAHAFASIENTASPRAPGHYRALMRIPADFLNSKSYFISIYVSSFEPTRVHAMLKDVLVLNVIDDPASITRQRYQGPFPGAIRPALNWSVDSL